MNKSAVPYHTKFLILTALGLLMGVCTSYAQEGQFPGSSEQEERHSGPSEAERMEEGNQIWDNSPSIQSTTSEEKTSAPVIRPATKVSEKKDKGIQGKEDESVLSFNFLYYIIQKFKLSESVE